jgi:hypothetical protein
MVVIGVGMAVAAGAGFRMLPSGMITSAAKRPSLLGTKGVVMILKP